MEAIKKKLITLKAEKETALEEVDNVKAELKESKDKCGVVSFAA